MLQSFHSCIGSSFESFLVKKRFETPLLSQSLDLQAIPIQLAFSSVSSTSTKQREETMPCVGDLFGERHLRQADGPFVSMLGNDQITGKASGSDRQYKQGCGNYFFHSNSSKGFFLES